ncbi:MAG TPA: dihydrofolate reductase [Alphaproteobacteria bacterium]
MADPKTTIIAALSQNDVIGKDNQLLWQLPADMAHFKNLTSGHAVIMGRKTYESLPPRFRPLPNRLNIILSRQKGDDQDGKLIWADNLDDALTIAKKDAATKDQEQVFIIGGGEIYKQSLPFADRLYLTHIKKNYEGDAFFPRDYKTMQWRENTLSTHEAANGQPAFDIIQYDRIS